MRKIKKLSKPQVLVDNADKWTREYCLCLSTGQKPSETVATRYNNSSIRASLERETHGKCAYCESKLKHIEYGDIEHILPKSKRPDLYVEWSNLTLACEQCNRSGKKAYYDPQLLLINPYVDDPEQHFLDLGPSVRARAGDNRAYITEKTLQLNRPALLERRNDRITAIEPLLNAWKKEQIAAMKDVLEQQLHSEYTQDKEFSSTIKAYLYAEDFPVLEE